MITFLPPTQDLSEAEIEPFVQAEKDHKAAKDEGPERANKVGQGDLEAGRALRDKIFKNIF